MSSGAMALQVIGQAIGAWGVGAAAANVKRMGQLTKELAYREAANLRATSQFRQSQNDLEASRLRISAAALKDEEKLGLAAKGLDVGSGSAAGAQVNRDIAMSLDQQIMDSNALLEAWQTEERARLTEHQGDIAKQQAKAAKRAMIINNVASNLQQSGGGMGGGMGGGFG